MDFSPEAAGRPGAPRYAGFWIRVFANVLDVLLLAAIAQALFLVTGRWSILGDLALDWTFYTPSGGSAATTVGLTGEAWRAAIAGIAAPIVFIGCWRTFGATAGKMMCGVRVIDAAAGGRPTLWQCIGRYFLGLIAVSFVVIGYLWIAIDARKQGWHDKMVRTLVIHRDGGA